MNLQSRKYRDALRCLAVLNSGKHQAMLAGGCVRDRLMGIDPKDYDIATSARPEEAMTLLSKLKCKIIPTGIEHGTITIAMHSGPVEVTTLRRDVSTDGRHAVVEFGSCFEEDASRRDFTINAMFEDAEGHILDFFRGKQDLERGILRFVGDAAKRIEEDYLRILRFFRFYARFQFEPDDSAIAAIEQGHQGLRRVSIERITSELLQLLACQKPSKSVASMARSGVLKTILSPWLHESLSQDLSGDLPRIHLMESLKSEPSELCSIARLQLLMREDLSPKDLGAIASHFRLSNKQSKALEAMRLPSFISVPKLDADAATSMEFLDELNQYIPLELIPNVLEMWEVLLPSEAKIWLDLRRLEQASVHMRCKKTLVNGHDLLAVAPGLSGKQLGLMLRYLRRLERNGEITDKEEALKIVTDLVALGEMPS